MSISSHPSFSEHPGRRHRKILKSQNMKRNVPKQEFLVMKLLLNELTAAVKPQQRGSQGPSLSEDLWVKKERFL